MQTERAEGQADMTKLIVTLHKHLAYSPKHEASCIVFLHFSVIPNPYKHTYSYNSECHRPTAQQWPHLCIND